MQPPQVQENMFTSPFREHVTYVMYLENLTVRLCCLVSSSCFFVSTSSLRYSALWLRLTRLQCRVLFFPVSLSLLFENCSRSNNTRPMKNTRMAHSTQVKEMLEASRQMVKWSPSKTR